MGVVTLYRGGQRMYPQVYPRCMHMYVLATVAAGPEARERQHPDSTDISWSLSVGGQQMPS